MPENAAGITIASWNSISFNVISVGDISVEEIVEDVTLISDTTPQYESTGFSQVSDLTLTVYHDSDLNFNANVLGQEDNLVITFPLKGAESSGATITFTNAVGKGYAITTTPKGKNTAAVTFAIQGTGAVAAGS